MDNHTTRRIMIGAAISIGMVAAAISGRADGTAVAPLPPVPGEYIVHWPMGSASALSSMEGVRVLSDPGSDELEKLGDFVVIIEDGGSIDAILDAGAEYVEPNVRFTMQAAGGAAIQAADPLFPQQWQHAVINSANAWQYARGAGVRVAVVDSGVGPHEDLAVIGGKDFTGGDGRAVDHNGHGTHVAGICCARGDNGLGGAGVAPLADVLAVRVLDSSGSGDLDAIAAGIVWAADNGARVINLSLGGPSGTRALSEALAYAVGRGALPVCAAGNDGSTRTQYPAAFADCLSVGASTRADAPAGFTNRAPTVDISAPGDGILSTCRGDAHCVMSGTSMAAPVVAGVAALVASQGPISPAALSWRLRSTARILAVLPGGRRVDAGAAVARPTALPQPPTLAPRPTAPAPAPSVIPPTATAVGVRIIPIAVPPGCRVVIMCEGAAPPAP